MPVFNKANILLPKNNFEKWAVIACDQHTGNAEYWKDVTKTVGDAPSTLDLIIPEIYLSDDNSSMIAKVNENMQKYIESGVFEEHNESMIYVERQTKSGIRHGIVGMLDLNEYDYRKGSKSLIRATEMTVTERIPPRVNIRKNAILELPHILILIDDPDFKIIAPCEFEKSEYKQAYSFDLMKDGGHIDGYFINDCGMNRIISSLDALCENSELVYAVGDGNHSLAAAKECVNTSFPASRYALCEVVNIHEPSLVFEPIYRVVYGVSKDELLKEATYYFKDLSADGGQKVLCLSKDGETELSLPRVMTTTVATLTAFLDDYKKHNNSIVIDYIHGEDEARRIANEGAVAFLFDVIGKSELFEAVRKDGALVRKTFSMGEACDKRYYLEARYIK